eukprot:TRINITY_DN67773_c0_g1_i14.p1 TRINITY_DN67773_c0_g1~~TRINITY_DN67773_c0_g1_i14.p1  ORF type:complete len:248 (-),score=19.43 TRINITY_DN67773_c0_g1_i14:56-799(-)
MLEDNRLTTRDTLLREENTFFTAMLNGPWLPDKDGEYFIDRSPELFPVVLSYLRDGQTPTPSKEDKQNAAIVREFGFYQISAPLDEQFFPLTMRIPKPEGGEWANTPVYMWRLKTVVAAGTTRHIPLQLPNHRSFPRKWKFRVHCYHQHNTIPFAKHSFIVQFTLSGSNRRAAGVCWATTADKCPSPLDITIDRDAGTCSVGHCQADSARAKRVLQSRNLYGWIILEVLPGDGFTGFVQFSLCPGNK